MPFHRLADVPWRPPASFTCTMRSACFVKSNTTVRVRCARSDYIQEARGVSPANENAPQRGQQVYQCNDAAESKIDGKRKKISSPTTYHTSALQNRLRLLRSIRLGDQYYQQKAPTCSRQDSFVSQERSYEPTKYTGCCPQQGTNAHRKRNSSQRPMISRPVVS